MSTKTARLIDLHQDIRIPLLRHFIGQAQLRTILHFVEGDEGEHFIEKLREGCTKRNWAT